MCNLRRTVWAVLLAVVFVSPLVEAATLTAMVQRVTGLPASNATIYFFPSNTPAVINGGFATTASASMRTGSNGWASNNLIVGNYRFNIDQSTRDQGVVYVPDTTNTLNLWSLLTSSNVLFNTNISAFIRGVVPGPNLAVSTNASAGTVTLTASLTFWSNGVVIGVVTNVNWTTGVTGYLSGATAHLGVSASGSGGTNSAGFGQVNTAQFSTNDNRLTLKTNLSVTNLVSYGSTNIGTLGVSGAAVIAGSGSNPFIFDGASGRLDIGDGEVQIGPGVITLNLAGPLGYRIVNTDIDPVNYIWGADGLGNQTNKNIALSGGLKTDGPITNLSLTASKLIRTDANKMLVSSSYNESDLALAGATNNYQPSSATLTNLSNTGSNNSTYATWAATTAGTNAVANFNGLATNLVTYGTPGTTNPLVLHRGTNGLAVFEVNSNGTITTWYSNGVAQLSISNNNGQVAIIVSNRPAIAINGGNGFVGINTNNPAVTFAVSGTVEAGVGSAGVPAYRFNNDNDSGFISPFASGVDWVANGAASVRLQASGGINLLNNSGSVGFGVSTDAVLSRSGAGTNALQNNSFVNGTGSLLASNYIALGITEWRTNTLTSTLPNLSLGSYAFANSNGLTFWKGWNTNGSTVWILAP